LQPSHFSSMTKLGIVSSMTSISFSYGFKKILSYFYPPPFYKNYHVIESNRPQWFVPDESLRLRSFQVSDLVDLHHLIIF
jgi:hypothetical protein